MTHKLANARWAFVRILQKYVSKFAGQTLHSALAEHLPSSEGRNLKFKHKSYVHMVAAGGREEDLLVILKHVENPNFLNMQDDVKIRMATINDLSALQRVGNNLFDNPIKKDRAIEFLNDSRHHLVLAFRNEDIIGMASGVHYVHPDKDPELFMNEVGVLDEFQNKKIGRSLVKYLWAHAKSIGCKEAWIGTEKSNVAAQKCYLGAGGEPEDEPYIIYEFEDDSPDAN